MLSTEDLSTIADQENVPLSLLLARYQVESSGGQADTSVPHHGGVRGGFQVKDDVFHAMISPTADPKDEFLNARAAARYLREGLDKYGDDPYKAALYYGGGPNEAQWGPNTRAAADKTIQIAKGLEDHHAEMKTSFSMPAKAALSGTDPSFANLAAQISTTAQEFQAAAAKQAKDSEQFQADYNDAARAEVSSLGGVGRASAGVAAALAAQQAVQQVGTLNVLANSGLDDASLTNEQARLTRSMRDGSNAISALRADLNAKAEAVPDFLSNPIGWIVGSYQLRGDIARHNNALGQFQEDEANLKALTSSALSVEAVNLGKTHAAATGVALAKALVNVEEAGVQQAKVQAEAARVNATFGERNLQNKLHTVQLLESQFRVLEYGQTLEDKRAAATLKKQVETATIDAYSDAAEMIGQPRFNSLHEIDKLKGPRRAALDAVYASGGQSFGTDAVDAFKNVAAGDPARMPLPTRTMLEFEKVAYEKAKEKLSGKPDASGVNFDHKKPAEQNAAISDGMRKYFDEELQKKVDFNAIAGKDANPYRAPPLEALLTIPEFKSSTMAKFLLETKAQNPSVQMTDKFIVAAVTDEFLSGTRYNGSIEAATKDLEIYFKAVLQSNNFNMAFTKWGLSEQKGYWLAGKDWAQRKTIAMELASSGRAKAAESYYMNPEQPVLGP